MLYLNEGRRHILLYGISFCKSAAGWWRDVSSANILSGSWILKSEMEYGNRMMNKAEKRRRTVAVIGGGAAGMMAAIEGARAGAVVTLIEKNPELGKKLATTGNGRCNYTNLNMADRIGGKYRGSAPAFSVPALDLLPPDKVIAWFREIGVEPRFRGSYVYPHSEQAAAVVQALAEELQRLSVKLLLNEAVQSVECLAPAGFRIQCRTAAVQADRVILAAGSKAVPKTGSNGDGYFLARRFGHRITPYVPALCGIQCAGPYFPKLSGIRIEAELTLTVDGREAAREYGELQLTDYGISGIPVFQLSRYAAYALQEGRKTVVYIDFLPAERSGDAEEAEKTDRRTELVQTEEGSSARPAQIMQLYRQRRERLRGRRMATFFTGLLHEKLGHVLLSAAGIAPTLPIEELSDRQLRSLAALTASFKAECVKINDYAKAQVVAGGIDTEEVDPVTMQSRIVPGLYFAGEVLDIDGRCGGYNLQWAWASGYAAGRAQGGTN